MRVIKLFSYSNTHTLPAKENQLCFPFHLYWFIFRPVGLSILGLLLCQWWFQVPVCCWSPSTYLSVCLAYSISQTSKKLTSLLRTCVMLLLTHRSDILSSFQLMAMLLRWTVLQMTRCSQLSVLSLCQWYNSGHPFLKLNFPVFIFLKSSCNLSLHHNTSAMLIFHYFICMVISFCF